MERALKLWFISQRILAAVLLVVSAPLWIGLAILIRSGSPGKMLVRQDREGRGGAIFGMFKLRTMHCDADARLASILADGVAAEEWRRFGRLGSDPRIAGRFGGLARRYSIDELPQLINVVRGEMALVGPRPLLPQIAIRLQPEDLHARRQVAPGLTGLWQVSGRSDLDLETMGQIDRDYVKRRSLWLDLSILLRTLPTVIFARGAY